MSRKAVVRTYIYRGGREALVSGSKGAIGQTNSAKADSVTGPERKGPNRRRPNVRRRTLLSEVGPSTAPSKPRTVSRGRVKKKGKIPGDD